MPFFIQYGVLRNMAPYLIGAMLFSYIYIYVKFNKNSHGNGIGEGDGKCINL